jgi:hypothetical protein
METGFDIVVTLVTQGPAAAWEKIQESLSNLREMVMEQIMTFVRDRVVQAAVIRLVSMLNPAGAFIQAIIAIYNTVMFFIERLRQIAQVAMSFIDSIAAIAAGNIAAAANRVEQTMAGLLTLVISFLARLAGLGRVSDAVTNVINRVRQPIDRALDRVVEWIVAQARRLGRFIAQAGVPQDPNERLRLGMQAAVSAVNRFARTRVGRAVLDPVLAGIKIRFGFQLLEPRERAGKWTVYGTVNPTVSVDTDAEVAGILPLSPITAAERATIAAIAGGPAQLTKLDDILAGGGQPAKINAETAVIRTVLAAIAQGKSVQYIGLELFRRGESAALTEIDVLTADEMIEIKSGDYSRERKLSGRDMNQFTNMKRFFERKIAVVDAAGNTINPPSKWVYQFTNPISRDLYVWLKDKGVSEVRTAV